MPRVTIDQQKKRVEVSAFEIDNEILFTYFNGIPFDERDDVLFRALYMGTLALMEDRLSTFLAKTESELGVRLESLKLIFDMKKEIFYKSAVKGLVAEVEIAEFLNQHFIDRAWSDRAELTGGFAGALRRNKTGDIVSIVNGDEDRRIVVECKFDKSTRLGEIDSKDIFGRRMDTAWSQMLEAQVNREGRVAIIVFDETLVDASIQNSVENVGYIEGVGFIAIVDSQAGNYSNLAIAYGLARDIVMHATESTFDGKILSLLIRRIIRDLQSHREVRSLIQRNIDTNRDILSSLEKSLLSMEFTYGYLCKFLEDGQLSKDDLLEFYMGEQAKTRYADIEKEILELIEGS